MTETIEAKELTFKELAEARAILSTAAIACRAIPSLSTAEYAPVDRAINDTLGNLSALHNRDRDETHPVNYSALFAAINNENKPRLMACLVDLLGMALAAEMELLRPTTPDDGIGF